MSSGVFSRSDCEQFFCETNLDFSLGYCCYLRDFYFRGFMVHNSMNLGVVGETHG